MRKLLFLFTLVVLAFYAAWPAYSLYELANGIKTKQEDTVSRKVAWVPLRQSLVAPVTTLVNKEISNQTKGKGIEGALAGQLAGQMAPTLVKKILDAYVTPKGIIALANQGGKIKTSNLGIGNALNGIGGNSDDGLLGGLLGKAKELVGTVPGGKDLLSSTIGKLGKDVASDVNKQSKTSSPSKKISYGLNNIKSFNFIDLWSFEIGLAKSPTATKPDVIAGMSFIDRDWKLSKLVPTF